MGKAVSGSRAVQPQEMVENSFSRASWLRVWKARFLRTLVLMDRTWEGSEKAKGRENSQLLTAEGRPGALGQDKWSVLAGDRLVKKGCESQSPSSGRLYEELRVSQGGLSVEKRMHFYEEQTNHRGKECVCLSPGNPGGFSLCFTLSKWSHRAGSKEEEQQATPANPPH